MHFFGLWGSVMFFICLLCILGIGGGKLYCLAKGIHARLITDNPYFYLALTGMILGFQLFLTGFLGELVSRNSQERNNYKVEKEI